MKSTLDKMREFVRSFPGASILDGMTIDYTDKVPNCAGLFPSGQVEVSKTTDIFGDTTFVNQHNFALYTRLEKSPDEDEGAEYNAEWQMEFQEWVQRQSAIGRVPVFGDEPREERITAQNGAIYSVDEEGTALYAIQLSVRFIKHYTKEMPYGY